MESKHYFLFNLGSWWVYEEETTHERDSMYVVLSENDETSPNFSNHIYSPSQNYYYRYNPLISSALGCTDMGTSYNKCIYIKCSKGVTGDFVGEEECFFSQYYEGASTATTNYYFPDSRVTFAKIYENYDLGNFSFNRTLKVHINHSEIEGNSPVNTYYVKGIGLIRKEIIDSNQVWNLVNYDVSQ